MLKKLQIGSSTYSHCTWIGMACLIKDSRRVLDHDERGKECKVCPDEFRLELVTDIDMLLMVEKDIRGGIAQAVKHYAKANNKYMKDLCNPDEESVYLQYLDANSFYGWAMFQNLPTHGFKWEDGEDFTPEKIDELVKKDKRGYLRGGRCEVSKRAARKS